MDHPFVEEDIVRLRSALARIARSIDRQVSADGLSRTRLSVLGTVARRGPIGMGELADVEGLNPTMLSRIVGKMTAEGVLKRVQDERDGRAVLVEVTPEGAALQERLRTERTQLFAERLVELPDGLAEQLLTGLPALEALADVMRRKPALDPPEGSRS
jgi:DNA-binding MarR family transcriptional regulator